MRSFFCKKTFLCAFIMIFEIVFVYNPHSAQAMSFWSSQGPEKQCEEGIQNFVSGNYETALKQLDEGFSKRNTIVFTNQDTLGICAMLLGKLHELSGDYDGARTIYFVALEIFQKSGNLKYEGTAFGNIEHIYTIKEDYIKSLEYSEKELDIAIKLENLDEQARTWVSIGYAHHKNGDLRNAETAYLNAISIFNELKDQNSEALVLNNLGGVYAAMGKYTNALDVYNKALRIYGDLGEQAGPTTWNNIAEIYSYQGRYSEAISAWQKANEIFQKNGDRAGQELALGNLGTIYAAIGEYDTALSYHKQSLEITRELGIKSHESRTLFNISTVYEAQGRIGDALDYKRQALEIADEINYLEGQSKISGGIGEIYKIIGQYKEAINYYQRSLTLAHKSNNPATEADALDNMGSIYELLGENQKTLSNYEQALAISKEIGYKHGETTFLYHIGSFMYDQENYEQSLNYLNQALAISQEINETNQGNILSYIGKAYIQLGDLDNASAILQKAQGKLEAIGDHQSLGSVLSDIGLIYYHRGDVEQAYLYLEKALSEFEEVRAVAGNDSMRASFASTYIHTYEIAIKIAFELGKTEDAFYLSERGRARAFLDSLSTGHIEMPGQDFSLALKREMESYKKIQYSRDALIKARLENSPDTQLISDLEAQLSKAEKAYEEAHNVVDARGDELAALVPERSTVLSLADIQSILDDQTTLVSYFIVDDKFGALASIITHNSFSVVKLPEATPTKLKTAVESLTAWPSLQDTRPQPLQDLYAWLIAPIKNQLKTPRVGIIPHLTLHYVPFAALTDGETYFGEQYQLFDLPSASSLRFIQQHAAQAANSGAVVFGNPATKETGLPSLPYAAAEADAVAKTLGVSDYIGTAATELQMRESVSGAAIVHLAAHGAYNQYNPLYSTLYLAPDADGKYDGRLEVHEIFGLNLKGSQLVVLSACETQLGQLSTGDEVVGMTRAFMFAGAPSVLASLWRVDDEATQTLMTTFYRHWREEGMNKAQALQAAQAEVRANPKWQSPYYWAAFVLSGDVGSISLNPVSELTIEPAGNPTATPVPTSNPPGPICPGMMLAPVAIMIMMFTTKRRPTVK